MPGTEDGINPNPVAFHYNPNWAAVGDMVSGARFYAGDTTYAPGPSPCDFDDRELQSILTTTGNVPQLAAAFALRALATDSARIATVTKKGTRGNDESAIYVALMATADALEKMAPVAPIVMSPDQIFSTGSDGGTIMGTMDIW